MLFCVVASNCVSRVGHPMTQPWLVEVRAYVVTRILLQLLLDVMAKDVDQAYLQDPGLQLF